jgi:hypothetical protein
MTEIKSNGRVERLLGVLDILHTQKPVNIYSTMCVIALKPQHNVWKYAIREAKKQLTEQVKFIRAMPVIDLVKLAEWAPKFEDQYILFVDDDHLTLDHYSQLKAAIKTINPDLAPRLFMTKEAPNAEA